MPTPRPIAFGIDDVIGTLQADASSSRQIPDECGAAIYNVKATPRPQIQQLIGKLQAAGHDIILVGDSSTEYAQRAVSLLMPDFPVSNVIGINDLLTGASAGLVTNQAMRIVSQSARLPFLQRKSDGLLLVDAKPAPRWDSEKACLSKKLFALHITAENFVPIAGFLPSGPIPNEPKLARALPQITNLLPSPADVQRAPSLEQLQPAEIPMPSR